MGIRNFQEEPTCSHLPAVNPGTNCHRPGSPGNRFGDGDVCAEGLLGSEGSRVGPREKLGCDAVATKVNTIEFVLELKWNFRVVPCGGQGARALSLHN